MPHPRFSANRRRSVISGLGLLLLASAWATPAPAGGPHPLDPLSAQEIAEAVSVIAASGKVNRATRAAMITLKEPEKQQVTGWAKGGKTETLLGFMAKGAEYVGDEWIYISPDGKWMYGIPEPIRLWDWHLRKAPQYWSRVSPSDRVRLRALGLAVRSIKWASADGGPGRHFALPGIRRVVDLLERQRYLQMPPRRAPR